MIITKEFPFSKEDIEKLSQEFQTYIKTVIDIEKKVCSAGANRHFENERILLDQNSKQSNLWGGGIDLDTKIIDNNSMINIRPSDNNTSNEIQDSERRSKFEQLGKYFFRELF
ncbi:MAG: hypothetical protein A2860_00295 [Candidatus Levybacteria bacterium RIFCSPHIGHO2_01_FULL_37_33]|nr:MAG: hypothetical protein A2860_00295 [Candidatus Levybacteria bacterium RIFCSPHIGHO2_01_FULL_37_33]OGH17125.1 MAG: hypothetical protein A3C97_00765 [Candidatus Levybacteria bacterium RIFCSPHIGHO2_02_FULL_37_11]OGH29841.1 MAG: hypothetical protein A3F30_00280 [Candidatus Levybacteria bacterium RIFCSPHIGHO2_12_FULL_37_12]OGH32891.1 MAG: hypothetical protein A2953_01990 [Candidatus Levybacteria bacterium RIFCSPLOWO2_01_FULL_36_54]